MGFGVLMMVKAMNPLRLRPRFTLQVDRSTEEVMALFAQSAERMGHAYKIKFFSGQIEIKLPSAKRHTWSPQLIMAVCPDEQAPETKTELRGRFGPMEGVWTLFMALYAVGACLMLGGMIMGASELLLSHGSIGRWLTIGSGLWLIVVYMISMTGQSLGQAQMDELRDFVSVLVQSAHDAAPDAIITSEPEIAIA